MFQHVGRRLEGRFTNRIHADGVLAVATYHKSAACNSSGGYVHASSLRFNTGRTERISTAPKQATILAPWTCW
jgi:hypothetical protein